MKYYFHGDHLGSSTLITDATGGLVQHLEYIPFGEVFVDERQTQSTWSTPYKFNGKELDEETGLYYYGARYYDPRTSVWISVDPLAEEKPNFTSYNYCSNNPINRIDPDGKLDGDNPGPSPAGILLERYLMVDAAVFNFLARGLELVGIRKAPNISIRKELPYDANGYLTSNKNKIVEIPINGTLQETKEIVGDALALYPGLGSSAKGLTTPVLFLAKTPGAKNAIIEFIKGKGSEAVKVITELPNGFKETKLKSYNQKVFSDGKRYITPDITSHKGGVWKMFNDIKKVGSTLAKDRMGTYDANLKKIAK